MSNKELLSRAPRLRRKSHCDSVFEKSSLPSHAHSGRQSPLHFARRLRGIPYGARANPIRSGAGVCRYTYLGQGTVIIGAAGYSPPGGCSGSAQRSPCGLIENLIVCRSGDGALRAQSATAHKGAFMGGRDRGRPGRQGPRQEPGRFVPERDAIDLRLSRTCGIPEIDRGSCGSPVADSTPASRCRGALHTKGMCGLRIEECQHGAARECRGSNQE